MINENFHRVNFGKIQVPIEPPPLLQVQKSSYDWFLQKDTAPEKRAKQGLEDVFQSVFPIQDYSENCKLEYIAYRLGEPKYTENECRIRGTTYAAPIRVSLRLIIWDKDSSGESRRIYDIKEQEIYLGEFPLMTDTGSFIINGTERVVVSQLHKSPGVFFFHDKGKNTSGKLLYYACIIPQRGSWVDFEFDNKDMLYVRIDRRRKFLATTLLRALGFTTEYLLKRFYYIEEIDLSQALNIDPEKRVFQKRLDHQTSLNQRALKDILDPKTQEILVPQQRKINKLALRKLEEANIEYLPSDAEDILGRYSAEDIKIDEGQVLVKANQMVTEEVLEALLENKIPALKLLYIGHRTIGAAFRNTLAIDNLEDPQDALVEFYKKMKPGEPPTKEVSTAMLNNLFFNSARYDLSRVGRMKMNKKLNMEEDLEKRTLSIDDIFRVVEYLLRLREGLGEIDDIDHLGNRRIRSVGELLEGRFRLGLMRLERAIKERMSLQENETMMLNDIVNSKPVTAAVNEFFGNSQVSQFMDQTNPLAEITHKRRLSALGPGGLTRERAGFEVRDVHSSHYGRICPVETPEGPNIGLIASLTTYARLNEFGFIETPYRKVDNAVATNEIQYLSAIDEVNCKIVQANTPLGKNKELLRDFVSGREDGEFKTIHRDEIEYMDLAPKQLVSVAASLIPFLEHDDANRALMGSNMQRQAVPLIRPQAPLVGTGMEAQVARDSGACVVAKRSGKIRQVDARRIIVETEVDVTEDHEVIESTVDIYHLQKYRRSNQNTCINQRILVNKGQKVQAMQILADGAACDHGELSLGQNMLVAFMPWNGYNFEDSIVISEHVLRDDRFTSVHIEELEIIARDTKLGKESITRDIPNTSEQALRNLDESGIIRIGSYVTAGDILVGKTTPKGETQLNPEEKLLRAIFGDKAGDVKDTSLRVPQAVEGVVIDVRVFNRRGEEKDARSQAIEQENLQQIEKDYQDQKNIILKSLFRNLHKIVQDQSLKSPVQNEANQTLLKVNTTLTAEVLENLDPKFWEQLSIGVAKQDSKIQNIAKNAKVQLQIIENICEKQKVRELRQDELSPGVIREVKTYIAVKRWLSVGDKMAGRHGNKGVISKIVPVEEMPFLEDGTPVDVVLNPLGVPSRMNVGQILETHLGYAARQMGEKINLMLKKMRPQQALRKHLKGIYKDEYYQTFFTEASDEEVLSLAKSVSKGLPVATPVFDHAEEVEILDWMKQCGLDSSGQAKLYDGRSGEPFEQKVTVGYMYILKLHHLVEDKLHARSTGPYSLVTQQPLGGKAQFGGQRFGEMEVWALEAYGAAYTLREMLTVKSDDIVGRNKVYEAIIKGMHDTQTSIPESFKVLINEMKSLCLDLKLIKNTQFLEEIKAW